MKYHTPGSIRAPFASYSHGVEISPNHRLVFCSGQLGISLDDQIPEDAGQQAELCFANIRAILRAADMDLANIVRINAFVTDRAWLKPYMAVRDTLFARPTPASTLMIVSGFANEAFKVEIEVIAAAADHNGEF